jgi:hypothetical protein
MTHSIRIAIGAFLLVVSFCAQPRAQWLNHRDAKAPRTADGKTNLAARAPRTPQGTPDFSGVWRAEPTPVEELTRLFGDLKTLSVPGDDPSTFPKYLFNILADFKPGEEPIRPEAQKLFGQRAPLSGRDFPTSRCLPAGVPNGLLIPIPFKILQTPDVIAILFEGDNTIRQVYMDGRVPPPDPQPLWLGYSVGKWERDVLVVTTTGFNDKSWLDAAGHPHSEQMRVVERFRRRDFGHIDAQATIDDPKMYSKPFTITFTLRLQPDTDILELFCAENEKDSAHMGR